MIGSLRALVLSVIGALLLSACDGEESPPGAGVGGAGFALAVAVATVQPTVFQVKLQVVGSTRSDESVDITSTVVETIAAIHFEDGQRVEKGDELVTLSQSAETAQRDQAQVTLAREQRELQRLKGLLKTKSISPTEYDRQETAAQLAQLLLTEAETRIADRTIQAPFDGVIGLRELSIGALVSPGARITTLDKIDPLKVDFRVPATQRVLAGIGAKILARTSINGHGQEGTIVAVGSRINPDSRTLEARALLPNPDHRLIPGMLLRVTLFGSEVSALKVPEQSILQLSTSHYVFRVNSDSTVTQQQVTIVGRDPGWVYIGDGLSVDDRVAIEATHRLRNGQKIAVKSERPEDKKAPNTSSATDGGINGLSG
ncbi:MAG: membrane fusion protein (multidrug efflux system) [Halieaceae bacterium]|jgi:membrane fusion protein (multidrug efflux system)